MKKRISKEREEDVRFFVKGVAEEKKRKEGECGRVGRLYIFIET